MLFISARLVYLDKNQELSNSNYIEKIFHKNREDISLEDIEEFFKSPQEETSVLEFKTGEVEIIKLYKEIAAFLNTEGGLIIVGSPKEENKTVKKNTIVTCQGDLTYSNFGNKDRLYQKIASNIVPSPTNLKIEEFLTAEGAVFLIDVPQSLNPPHQCSSEGKYYIRMEREAKPAPHGLVQALFNKRKRPELTSKIKYKERPDKLYNINLHIENHSTIPVDMLTYTVEIYNISNADTMFRLVNDDGVKKYSYTDSISHPLPRFLSHPIDFNITHLNKEFMVFVALWGKNSDFTYIYWTIDPIHDKIVNTGTYLEGIIYVDEVERIMGK